MPDFGRWTSNGGDPSLNEINRADRFLDALATKQPVYSTDAGEAELIYLLPGWRDEMREAPLSVPVTPRDAVMALDARAAGRHRSRRTLRSSDPRPRRCCASAGSAVPSRGRVLATRSTGCAR